MGTGAAPRRARQNPLSWICFALTEFRLLCFAQVGSICSLSGLVHFVLSVRPQIRLGLLTFGRSNVRPHMGTRSLWVDSVPAQNPLSWICFALTEFRLLCFAQVGSICSLTGFVHFVHSIRPQIRLGLLAFTRFRISFRIFILKILHYINLVHMAVRSSVSQTRLHSRTKSAKKNLRFYLRQN